MDQPRGSQAPAQHTAHGEVNSTSRAEDTSTPQIGSVLFREIHKNAWLKRLPSTDRKATGSFPKKGDRVWVVFCVHDDAEPFIEVYVDQKVAVMHRPDWCVSLNNCLHVSPTIYAQEEEYEFVVTLNSDVVRFTAPSWELMMEWVDTIRTKLREMRILSPRENLYTRMPEARLPLAPTRDPNSPLPPPPAGPSVVVPGVERVHSESSDENVPPTQPPGFDSVSLQIRTPTTSLYITQSEPSVYTRPHAVLSRAASFPESPVLISSLMSREPSRGDTNVTVIEVSDSQRVPHSAIPLDYEGVFNFNFIEDALPSVPHAVPTGSSTFHENLDFREELEFSDNFYTPPVTPARTTEMRHQVPPSVTTDCDLTSSIGNGQMEVTDSGSSYYECVFLPNETQSPQSLDSHISIASNSVAGSRLGSEVVDVAPGPAETSSVRSLFPGNTVTEVRVQESVIATVPAFTDIQQRRRRRSSSTSETASSSGISRVVRVAAVTGAERNRAATQRVDVGRRLQPAPHPYRQAQQASPGVNVEVLGSGRLTLREQQVLQLRREMLHPGGVRLQLRRKDCTGSVALVDAFGAVWITGWKQRERPMLYNALHIGDQLLSIASIMVQSASDAQKLIRGATSLYVEFVIRRVPFGRVFAICREVEGQSLGILQEGNTAEIRDVIPGGLAASHGLTPRAQTCDGLSLTNWVITEINGRPLNLFFKDGEVRDRLNAVGKEISILVQPFDLIKQLKKQLKALRGYKEYIVQ
ncbi:uncharacterized protein LOC110826963 isoform X3 [Zootermopsis nevadensis]|uniref:uncharacterized protein LOC110826963 isoform X3 n=1 Tax=Zootermopsis nevadensis TaxID=136037 RepID=UPI000B8ECBA2|nr:uncharacterized protein LOC110826963 isoform X3 [Zootermopsis nevadensis]